ncbi:MAG: adenylate/guanylate cyclase domain-containing protein [archaeon]
MRMLALIFALVLAFPFVSAEIILPQLNTTYNLNDALSVDVSINENNPISGGLLIVSLVCPSGTIPFYANGNINLAKEQVGRFDAVWNKISGVSGRCYVKAELESETARTEEFVITDRIDVSLELSSLDVNPSSSMIVKGAAVKANSLPAEGTLEISVKGLVQSQYVAVENGRFAVEISLPSDTPAGDYEISAVVFEKNEDNEITNRGTAQKKFTVVSVPSGLSISLDSEKIIPNKTIAIKSTLYDQSSEVIYEPVSITIKNSAGETVLAKDVLSGSIVEYKVGMVPPGEWNIKASAKEFDSARAFVILPYEDAEISISGSTITVKNTGNVDYKKEISATITSENGTMMNVTRNVNIDVGKEAKLQLLAPEGVYNVEISGVKFSRIPLTGAVSASLKLESQPGILAKSPVISAMVFSLIVAILLVFQFFARGSRTYKSDKGTAPVVQVQKISSAVKNSQEMHNAESFESAIIPQMASNARIAEPSLVIQGQKQNASILYLKLKNLPEIREKISVLAAESLEKLAERAFVNSAGSFGGAVHRISSSEMLAVFSPMTRQFRHESSAVRAALKIDSELKTNNKKYRDKADYGIGIGSGEIALSINRKKILQYTSIGNTITLARKLAERSSREIVMSKEVYNRIINEVRARAAGTLILGSEEIECYVLESSTGREAYSSYLQDALRRIK